MSASEDRVYLQVVACASICTGAVCWAMYTHWRALQHRRKPQLGFKVVWSDNTDSEFQHLVLNECEEPTSITHHPYFETITNLILESTPRIRLVAPGGKPENLSWVWVDSKAQLKTLIQDLKVGDNGWNSNVAIPTSNSD